MNYPSLIVLLIATISSVVAQQMDIPQALVLRQGYVDSVAIAAVQTNPKNTSELIWKNLIYIPNSDRTYNLQSAATVRSSNTIFVLTTQPNSQQLTTEITVYPIGAPTPSRTFSYPGQPLRMLAYNPFHKRLTVISNDKQAKSSFCVIDPVGNMSCVPYPQLDYSTNGIPLFFQTPNGTFAYAVVVFNGAGSASLWVDQLDDKGFPAVRLWGPNTVRRLNWQDGSSCAASGARYGDATYRPLSADYWFPCGIGEFVSYYPPVIDYDAETDSVWCLFSALNSVKTLGQFSATTGKLSSQWNAPVFSEEPARPFAAVVKPT